MQTMRNAWEQTEHQSIFNDDYGILKLVADATLIKTPVPSKWVDLQWGGWKKRVLPVIKQLWPINTLTLSEFIWLEPDMYIYKIIDEPYTKPTKKSGISLGSKNASQKSSKECIVKK